MAINKGFEVLEEFPPVGRYRLRIMRSNGGEFVLDVREFLGVRKGNDSGFTRHGIRLSGSEASDLKCALEAIISRWESVVLSHG